jgi:7-cyano-7-deazaguanine synthase
MPLNSFISLDYPIKRTSLREIVDGFVQIKPNDAEKEKSCAIVLSGGMDSVTCLAAVAHQYQYIHLLHFKYGARAEEREIESVKSILDWFENKYPDKNFYLKFIDLDFIKNLGGSTLTDHLLEIAHGEYAIETTHEWVPARNIAMIGLATSYCDRYNIGAIILGLNMEEGGIFEDNSIEFYQRMEAALQIGSHSQPKLLMPMGNSMKHHIWRKARELDAPLHLSWSCYEGKDKRCGICGPCSMRQRAAAMNGEIDDLVEYEERDPVAIQIFNKVRAN